MSRSFGRWARFNLVGVGGFVLQLALLAALTRITTWPLSGCVAVAVLVTVSHNFYWHQRYTWGPSARRVIPGGADAARLDASRLAGRWVAFNLSNGAVSLACNVIVTGAVTAAGVPVLAASVAAIGVASVVNFLVSDRLIFTAAGRPAVPVDFPSTTMPSSSSPNGVGQTRGARARAVEEVCHDSTPAIPTRSACATGAP